MPQIIGFFFLSLKILLSKKINRHTNQANHIMNPTEKRRDSLWDHSSPGTIVMPTCIESNMTPEQLDAYAMVFRINEITNNLLSGNVLPSRTDRSPSPDPEYDASGRRTNTCVQRHRQLLEDERDRLIESAMQTIPNYQPPTDYQRSAQISEKVFVPSQDRPFVNFIGRLLGPRGATLKSMESKSGAQIFIRGKGSVKKGRGKDLSAMEHLNESLHCLIKADSRHKLDMAKQMVSKIINQAIEGNDETKLQQLRDLAVINGTFRDDKSYKQRQLCGACPSSQATAVTQKRTIHDADFEKDYKSPLSELDGGQVQYTPETTTLPPWRIDKINQKAARENNGRK